jgi:5-methyltetrahydrofolate--homocysteine methyltransferase
MSITISSITNKSIVISDGAWGTELAKLGDLAGRCGEVWNLEHPDRVQKVAQSYVDAGSQIILTNSFSGNRFQLKKYGLDDSLRLINLNAVQISKRAANDRALVFASMGPLGKMISMEEISADEAYDAFCQQAAALQEGGADGIVAETMSDAAEMKCALRAIKDKTGLFAVASYSFDSGPDKTHTMMGVSAEQAVAAAEEAGADVIGANCGTGINNFVNICTALKKLTQKPVWIKGNAGLPEIVNARSVYKMKPDEFAQHALDLTKLGANIIGGCCGTTPAHLAALSKLLRK